MILASARQQPGVHPSGSSAYREVIERTVPGSTARAGLTDVDIDAPPLSIQESLEAGWSTAVSRAVNPFLLILGS